MLKKLLSLSLITLFLFQAVHFNLCSSYALGGFGSDNKANSEIEDPCLLNEKEKGYKFKNLVDAVNCGVKSLKRGDRSFSSTNIGPKENAEIWMWDYIQIGTAGKSLQDEIKKNKKNIISDTVILKVVDTIKTLFKTDEDLSTAIFDAWLDETKVFKIELSEREKIKQARDAAIDGIKQGGHINRLAKERGITFGSAFAVAAALVTAFIPGVRELAWGGYIASMLGAGITAGGIGGAAGYYGGAELEAIQDGDKRAEAIQKGYVKIDCYAMATEKILDGITKGLWKSGDMLYLDMNYDIKDHKVEAKFLDKGLYYTKEDRNNFEKTFKDIEVNLFKIVESNKEEL